MISLFYSKDQLRNYLISLSSIMTVIKSRTGQIFLPVVIQNSPLNPQTEMLIVMRSLDKNFDKYAIDHEMYLDENRLSKSFTIRTFQFLTSDCTERKRQMENELK